MEPKDITDNKELNTTLYVYLDETGLGLPIENEMPKDLTPIEPINEWRDREQLYTQVDRWLTLASNRLDIKYDQYKYSSLKTKFEKGISNPSNILYSPENNQIYIPFHKLELTKVGRGNENIGIQKKYINILFYKELANIARERAKFLTLMEEEVIEIDNWGEGSKRILRKLIEDRDFKTSMAVNKSDPTESNEITNLVISIGNLIQDNKLLDQ